MKTRLLQLTHRTAFRNPIRSFAAAILLCLASTQESVRAQLGTLDTNFLSAVGGGFCLAVQTDGKILAGGFSTIARLNTNGSLDAGFQATVVGEVWSIAVQQSGKVFIAGRFSAVNGTARSSLARLNPDGSLDEAFSPGVLSTSSGGGYDYVFAIVPQPDGMVLIGGEFSSIGGLSRKGIARLTSNGGVDPFFDPVAGVANPGVTDTIRCIGLQPDGKVLIGGVFTTVNGLPRNYVARLNSNGSLDTNFNSVPGPNAYVMSLAFQPDGGVIIGGAFTTVDNVANSRIARLLPNGQLDGAFNSGLGVTDTLGLNDVRTVLRQPNGDILLGGGFARINGVQRNGVGKLHADGTLDADFVPRTSDRSQAYVLALQSDGKVIVSGSDGLVRLHNFPPGVGPATLSLANYAGLTIEGTVGGRYRIEYSPDLNTNNWLFLTNVVLPQSPFLFVDVQSPGKEKRFYRALASP